MAFLLTLNISVNNLRRSLMSSTSIYKIKCSCIICKKEIFARGIHHHFISAHTEKGNQVRKKCGKIGGIKCQKKSKVLYSNITRYELNPTFCSHCGTKLPYKKRNNKFCDSSCAAKFNNKKRSKKIKESKNHIRLNLHNEKVIPNQSIKKTYSKLYYCKACGTIHNSHYSRMNCYCGLFNKTQILNTLVKYFNLDPTSIGSKKIIVEYACCINRIKEMYKNNSLISLSKHVGHPNPGNLGKIFKSLKIKTDNKSDALQKSIQQGRATIPQSTYTLYKSGWYEAKNKNRYFYRSSYELKFIQFLELNNIDFEMEKPVVYFDSVKNKQRIAMPDFFIKNLIVEIKSKYTFDEQNMIDKFKSYILNGYKPFLQLEFDYYILDTDKFLLLDKFNDNDLLQSIY